MTHDQGAVPPYETGATPPAQGPADQPAYGQTAYVQPQYGQPQYGQPAYGQPPRVTSTDGMSIAALITGILGLGAVPLGLGIAGLKRTKRDGTSGRGMAIAGIVLGTLSLVAGLALTVAVLVGGLAFSDAVDEMNAAATTAPLVADPPVDEGTTTDEDATTDDGTTTSETPLLDFVPLTVDGFSSAGLTEDAEVLASGALEAYTTTYTDGVDTVLTYVTDWSTAEESLVFATAVGEAFPVEQLTDSGLASDDGSAQYWVYEADGMATIVAVNDTVALTMTGPVDAVYALYSSFPL